ncbi:uncharacterized protein LOC135502462 [Lineus longissimus]|uniref:uncharacterized protein LOC135502462 n=1 Tax=Lineus longissimus TaxID=88925 RepID=UPI00315CBFE3
MTDRHDSEKRQRKENFTPREIQKLVDLLSARWKLISSKFGDNVTLERKNKAWKEITLKINSISPCLRTKEELKKKWDDLKLNAKKKASKKTRSVAVTGNLPLDDPSSGDNCASGGGMSCSLNDMDERIVGLMGNDLVQGIDGGFGSAARQTTPKSRTKTVKSPTMMSPSHCASGSDASGSDLDDFDISQGSPTFGITSKRSKNNPHYEGSPIKSPTPPPFERTQMQVKHQPCVKRPNASAAVGVTIGTPEAKSSKTAPPPTPTAELVTTEKQRLEIYKQRLKLEEKRTKLTETAVELLQTLVSIEKDKVKGNESRVDKSKDDVHVPVNIFEQFKKRKQTKK